MFLPQHRGFIMTDQADGYNFTDRIRMILQTARQIAAEYFSDVVLTDHLLKAMMEEPESVAFKCVRYLGFHPDQVVLQMRFYIDRPNQKLDGSPDVPYSSRMKTVVETAMRMSRELGDSWVGSEHFLLALLHIEKGGAFEALSRSGITHEQVCAVAVRLNEGRTK